MNKKRTLKTILLFFIVLIIALIGTIAWNLYKDDVDLNTLYNAPIKAFGDRSEIYKNKQIDDGYLKAIRLAADWTKDPCLGKIEIMNKPDFEIKEFRSVIRYVFQYEKTKNMKTENPCDREYSLKEVITAADGNMILRNRSWETNQCYESGTGPEILAGEINHAGIKDSYKSAIETTLRYLKPIIDKDTTLTIRNAKYSVPNKGFPENWWLQVLNGCWNTEISCPSIQITMSLSADGKQIWAVFINGTPEYIKQWKNLEYLNPKRPTIKNQKD